MTSSELLIFKIFFPGNKRTLQVKEKVIVHAVGHVTADCLKLMTKGVTVTKKMRTKWIGRYEYQIQIVSVPCKVCVTEQILLACIEDKKSKIFKINKERGGKEV